VTSTIFETPQIRHELLQIFKACNGHGEERHFTTESLGLWATFLKSIGLNPEEFQGIRHGLLECSFLNVAFDGGEDLKASSISPSSGIDCHMIPCVRTGDHPGLTDQGYMSIPCFFQL
jgi:hypothetical protein